MSETDESQQKLQDSAHEGLTQESEDTSAMDRECSEFQSLMAVRIRDGEDLQSYPHMLTCERCRSLVRELEYIAEAARQFFQEPSEEVEPPADVWNKIVEALKHNDSNTLELRSEA